MLGEKLHNQRAGGNTGKIREDAQMTDNKPIVVIYDDLHKVMVICGSAREANHYAKREGWGSWEYVSSVQSFRGQKDVIIAWCGSWKYRDDAIALAQAADDLVLRKLATNTYVRS